MSPRNTAAVLGLLAAMTSPAATQEPSPGSGSRDAVGPPSSVQPRVTVSWTQAPLRDVLRAFAAYSGRSLVAGSGVDGVFVTADIRDQPWDLALQSILASRGLTAEENEAGIIRVSSHAELADREALGPVVTRSYRIGYARASELRATFAALLTSRGSVSVLESANTIVVSDVERVHRVVRRLLGR